VVDSTTKYPQTISMCIQEIVSDLLESFQSNGTAKNKGSWKKMRHFLKSNKNSTYTSISNELHFSNMLSPSPRNTWQLQQLSTYSSSHPKSLKATDSIL